MNTVPREGLKVIALCIAGLMALWCVFVMGWCAIWKIYVDVPMLFVLSNLAVGIASCITTVLVGRTLAQLAQGNDSETTTRQTSSTEIVTKPKPSSDVPMVITKQPEVAIAEAPPVQDP